MNITVTAFQLAIIDRVVNEGQLGKTREAVLNAAVLEHAKYLMAGGHAFDSGLPNTLEGTNRATATSARTSCCSRSRARRCRCARARS